MFPKLNFIYVKLRDGRSSALGWRDLFDFHYLNSVWSSAMLSAHIAITLSDGALARQISIFPVHVVCT